jgi:serine-type D-Ala-D-Ala carboxypeptidase
MINNSISNFLQSRIEAKDFPSAVYLVAEKGEIKFQDALGFAVVEPEKIEAKIDTIYDLASLTKVLVTGLLCAKLIENKELNLSDKVAQYFPKFNAEITIQNLLTHTTGFKAWLPFYLISDSRFQIPDLITEESKSIKPNQSVVYSDFNFILLTFLLESVYKKTVDEIAKKEIFEPLNLQKTFYNPPKSLQKETAANEYGNQFELNLAESEGITIKNPKSEIKNRKAWGEVHDANCYFMNGVSGHAGLFSTIHETFKIAQQFLPNSSQLLKPETCELFKTNLTKGLNEARSIAFQLAETEKSTASEFLAKNSFGHLGFTGTSLWIEPDTERIFILFTNRTHAHELPFVNINSVRRKFSEFAVECLNNQ